MQALLQDLALGKVVENPLPVEGFARFVPYQYRLLTYPYHRAVPGQQAVLLPERLAAPRLEALVGGKDPLAVVWVETLGPQLLCLPLLGGVAKHLLYVRAGVERGVWIVYRVNVGDGRYLFHQGAVALLRSPDLLLCPFAVTNVLDLGDKVQRIAFFILHHRDAQEGPHYVAILVHVTLLDLVGAHLPSQYPAKVVEIRIEVVGVGYVLEGLLKQLFFWVAEYLAQGSVRPKEAPVCPHQRHPNGGVVEGSPEPLFTLPKRRLYPPALGYVEHEPLPIPGPTHLILDQNRLVANPHSTPVAVDHTILRREDFARLTRPLVLGLHPLSVRRVHHAPPHILVLALRGGVTGQGLYPGAHVHGSRVC